MHYDKNLLSQIFSQMIYEKGHASIRDVTEYLIAKGCPLSPDIIADSLEKIATAWLCLRPETQSTIIQPMLRRKLEKQIFSIWNEGLNEPRWLVDESGFRGGEFAVLDSIQWKFTKVWKKRYPNIPEAK